MCVWWLIVFCSCTMRFSLQSQRLKMGNPKRSITSLFMVKWATYAHLPFVTYRSYNSWFRPPLSSLQSPATRPSSTALCHLILSRGSTPLTCVTCLTSLPLSTSLGAAHLLPFCFVLGLHLLAGHVATETSLDLCSSPVGLWVVQWDVHDVLLLLGPAALLLQRGSESGTLSEMEGVSQDQTRLFFSSNEKLIPRQNAISC